MAFKSCSSLIETFFIKAGRLRRKKYMKKTFKTKRGEENQTILKVAAPADLITFLETSLPNKTRRTLLSMLTHRQISVDHKITTQYNHPLNSGQMVIVNWNKVLQGSRHKGLKNVFEDASIVVVEKPYGLLSIATDKEKDRTAYRILSDQAKIIHPKNLIFIVHRLDRDVSGLMVFAKKKDIQQRLQEAWDKDVIERKYVAVVEGVVKEDQGTITSWLKENKAQIMYSSQTPDDGQKAVTHFKVLKRARNLSLIEVSLETGRKNQIRVHMKDIGHSIVGDVKYGANRKDLGRLGLHAMLLAFRHPVTGEKLRFETSIPDSFSRLFNHNALKMT
jgi:23S rRNA pseudouridine1911/1915/1917 synthase